MKQKKLAGIYHQISKLTIKLQQLRSCVWYKDKSTTDQRKRVYKLWKWIFPYMVNWFIIKVTLHFSRKIIVCFNDMQYIGSPLNNSSKSRCPTSHHTRNHQRSKDEHNKTYISNHNSIFFIIVSGHKDFLRITDIITSTGRTENLGLI